MSRDLISDNLSVYSSRGSGVVNWSVPGRVRAPAGIGRIIRISALFFLGFLLLFLLFVLGILF